MAFFCNLVDYVIILHINSLNTLPILQRLLLLMNIMLMETNSFTLMRTDNPKYIQSNSTLMKTRFMLLRTVLTVFTMLFMAAGLLAQQPGQLYFEDFEGGNGGWVTGSSSVVNNWAYGDPDGMHVQNAYSGTMCWHNGIVQNKQWAPNEVSWVTSPKFDFSAVPVDPVFRMALTTWSFVLGNGLSLYYSTDSVNWYIVGSISDPNWYNTPVMNVLGGNGWSDSLTNYNPTKGAWGQYEHTLNGLAGEKEVWLRVYFSGYYPYTFAKNGNTFGESAFDDVLVYEPFNAQIVDLSTHSSVTDFVIMKGQCIDLGVNVGGFVAPVSIAWNTGQTGQPISVCPTATTTYTATVTDASKGVVVISATVVVVDTLTVAAEYDGYTVCDTARTTLYAFASGGTPPYTYAWSPTDSLSPTNAAVVVTTTHTSKIYSVTVTDANGFTAVDQVDVTVVSGYPFVDIVPNVADVCMGDSVQITAYGGMSYLWTSLPTGAYISNPTAANPFVIPFSTTAPTRFYCQITSPCGTATAFIDVGTKPKPAVPTFILSIDTVCIDGPAVNVAANSTFAPFGGTLQGDFPEFNDGLFYPGIAGVGTHYITYTVQALNGCTNFATQTIVVDTVPVIVIAGDDSACAGEVLAYTYTVVPGYGYNITVTGGALQTVGAGNLTVKWGAAGAGQIQILVTNLASGADCDNYFTYDVEVLPLPVPDIYVAPGVLVTTTLEYCEGESDVLTAYPGLLGVGFGPWRYDWYVDGGLYAANQQSITNTAVYKATPWQVVVSVYDSSTTCSANDTIYVRVYKNPAPVIQWKSFTDTAFLCHDECIDIFENVGTYTSYVWVDEYANALGTGNDSIKLCGSNYSAAGDTFKIYVTAGQNGCYTTDSMYVVVWAKPEVFNIVPNGTVDFCWNTLGPAIGVDSSIVGVTYELFRSPATLVNTLGGTGNPITFGNYNTPGNYYVVATGATGCKDTMNGVATLVSDTIKIRINSEYDWVCEEFTSRMTFEFLSDTTGYGPWTLDWEPDARITPDGYGAIIARPLVTTDFTLVVTGSDPLCQATDTFNLVVRDAPDVALNTSFASTPGDTAICLGSSIDLVASWTLGAGSTITNVVWDPTTELVNNGFNQTTASATVTPTAARTYVVLVYDENGCRGTDTVNVTVNNSPIVNINNNVPASLCPGYDTVLTANVTFGTGPYSYKWSTGPTTPSITVSPVVTTSYTVTVYDSTLMCYGTASITVQVFNPPTIDMNGPLQSCWWGELNLNPTITTSSSLVSTIWTQSPSNPQVLTIANTANPVVVLNGVATGNYKFYLTVTDVNGCVATDSLEAFISGGVSISAGPDEYICEGTTVTLAGQGGGTYEWYNAPGYNIANRIAQTALINVTPDTTTTYYLRVNNDSCGVATSQVTVYVHPATPVFFDGLATSYCEVDAPITLTNVTPVGGTFSGEGVNPVTGVFDPGAVTTLNAPITIMYSYNDSSAYPTYPVCTYTHSVQTIVYTTPVVTIGSLPAVCADAPSFPMTNFNGQPTGGTYTINGVSATTFNPGAGAGTFTIKYYYTDPVTTCDDSASTTFTVNPLPVKYSLTAVSPTDGNYFCDGDSATLTLSGSELGVTYYLYAKLSPSAPFQNLVSLAGTGSALTIGEFASEGFYYLLAINNTTLCQAIASDTLQLFERELPQVYNVLIENFGHYCAGGACLAAPCNGVNISMFSTNSEDKYFLYRTGNATPVSVMNGSVPSGSGKTFPGGPFTVAGEYYVIAIDTTSPAMCPREMANRVTITIDPVPVAKTITVPALCHCPGAGTPITVVSTEVGVDYVLYFGGVAIDTITGNGSSMSFAPVSTVGVYNVKGIKYNTYTTCVADMLNTVTVCQYEYVTITGVTFPDLNPATPLNVDLNGGDNLTFTATATGDFPAPGYQWQLNTGSSWVNIPSATNPVLNVGPVVYPTMKNYKYRLILTGYCNADTSDVYTLIVRPDVNVYAGNPYSKSLQDEQCANTISIPIYVEKFDSISSISLTLEYDETIMTFVGWSGTHSAFPGLIAGNPVAGKVSISWFSLSQSSVGDTVLTYLDFVMPNTGGFSTLEWDELTPGACQITSLNYNIDATYFDGSITGWSLPVPNANIFPNPICEGDPLYLTSNPYTAYSSLGANSVVWMGPNAFVSTQNNDTIPNVPLAAAGDYVLTVIDPHGCQRDTTITVVVNPLPIVYNVTGGGAACVGSAVEIGLDDSEVGIEYTLMYMGSPYYVTGYGYYTVMGTGSAVTFGPVTLGNQILGSATFTVHAVNVTTGCDIPMNGDATVIINATPFQFNVRVVDEGFHVVVGDYCQGGIGLPVKVMGSQPGVRYYLYYDPFCCACGNTIVDSLNGTGSAITFANQTAAGYYYVVAKNLTTGCETEMFNCVQILINPLPIAAIAGNSTICYGDTTSFNITFTQGKAPFVVTVNGVTYSGITANPYTIKVNPTGTTTYTLSYVSDANGCVGTFSGSAVVTVNPLPVVTVSSNSPKCVGETLNLYATGTGMSYQWSGPNGFTSTAQNPVITDVKLVNSGVYYVTVTNIATGCKNYFNTTVVINPLPVAIATAYPIELCVGEEFCLSGHNSTSAAGITSYYWSGPNGFTYAKSDTCIASATLAMSGVYYLTVGDANGCVNDTMVTVTVRPLPVAAISGDTEICVGECTQLIATGGVTYLWSNAMTNDTINVCPTDTTTYYVTVTNQYGCTDTEMIKVNVNPLPVKYELTRDGIYCFGCDGIPVNLLGSQVGVTYTLYIDGVAHATLAGTGSALYWGDLEIPGVYTVQGVVNATGCSNWMLNSITINLRPAPTVRFISDLDVCADECEDLVVELKGLPPFTVHYDDGSIAVFNVADLTLVGPETYQYTINICGSSAPATVGINLVEDAVCFHPGDTAIITVLPLPTVYDVIGGGYYCNIGINVGLAGSQVGVKYILYANGVSTGDTVLGTGVAISFGGQTQLGQYTVLAVNLTTGCDRWMDNYVTITSGNLPQVFTVTGTGPYCAGDSTAIGLNGSQTGVTYMLLLNGISTGKYVAGTGAAISFGYVTAVGIYTVQGIDDVTTCIAPMNGQVIVSIKPLPTATISGDANICKGDNTTLTVVFTGKAPFSFSLYNGVTTTTYSTSLYVWTVSVSPTQTRTYTITNVSDDNYCSNVGAGSATVVVSVPTKYTITGGGTYCEGGAGMVVGLNGSEVGVNYELRRNNAPMVPPVVLAGTGGTLNFGLQTLAGIYNVIATQVSTGCTEVMNGTVTISINPLPTAMNVTGGDSCCLGCTVIYLGLDSTEPNSNIRYELWLNGTKYINPLFPPKYGTGAAIEWGYMTQAGTYTILAVNEVTGCQRFMNGSAVAYFFPVPEGNLTGTDTICAGESTDLTITFTAGTPPYKVYVYNNDTLYFDNIMSNTFTFSTGPMAAGVHTYSLVQIADAVCYNFINSSVNIVVNALPTVYVEPMAPLCVDAPADTLDYGMPSGGTFLVNGVPSLFFDPAVLGVGTHTVVYEYTDSYGCSNSYSTTREVYELPVCTFVGGTYCVDAQPFMLYGSPAGGSFSGVGVSGGMFYPAVAGVGTHAVTYTYTDPQTGCTCVSTDNIVVINLPNVSFTGLVGPYCINSAPVTMIGSPVGGVFSGPGVTGNTFNPATAGVGTHIVTYAYSAGVCSNTAKDTVIVRPLPLEMPMSGGGRVCEYTNQIVGMGNTQAGIEYTLYVDGNSLGQTITGNGSAMSFGSQSIPGAYTVYAYDPITGCGKFMASSVSISWIPLPTVSINGGGTYCSGDPVNITFNFTGNPPFTLLYTAGAGIITASNINTYSYSITLNPTSSIVVDAISIIDDTCYNDGPSVNVFVLNQAAVYNVTGSGSYCAGQAGLTVGLSGSQSGILYQLYKNSLAVGAPVIGTGSALSFGLQTAGTYTVIANGTSACATNMNGNAVIVENPVPNVDILPSSASICPGENVNLTASGASSYLWSTGATTAMINVVPAATTTYTVTGTNSFGCTATADVTVTVNPAPVVTIDPPVAVICDGQSVTLTASGAASYMWSNGGSGASITVNPAVTTAYTVTGTNSFGCYDEATVIVNVDVVPVVEILASSAVICDGDDVTLTATGAATYVWSTGATTASITESPSVTTTYTVTGTSSAGCTNTASVTITVNPVPVVAINPVAATICAGDDVDLTASGATSYVWSTGATTAMINVVPGVTTTYTVTGTTAGCTAVASMTVTVNPLPVVAVTPAAPAICAGGNVNLTASGAASYVWSTGATTALINVAPTATTTYTVTGTTNGCTAVGTVTVTVNPLPTVTVTPAAPAICLGGTATLTANGAASYVWSTGATTAAINVTPLVTTTYTVTGTSAAGCTSVATVTVTVNTPPVVDLGADKTITIGDNVTLTPVVTGGSGSFSYVWTPGGQTTASINVSPTATTLYSVLVTDLGTGCTATDNVTVNVISVVGSISGNITYLNSALTPMSNTPVQLLQGSTVVATTTTNAIGNYTFSSVYAGSYVVKAAPNKPWGGGNSNDALLILKHFAVNPPLTGLYLKAADVNASGVVNSSDALLVAQRFVTLITSFPAGDWVSDENVVTIPVTGGNVVNNFNVLCTGDVNGSFTPAAKASETVQVTNKGSKQVSSYSNVELPISVTKDMSVGAISLVLNYPVNALEVNDVVLGDNAGSKVVFTDNNGELRISWYNTNARQMRAGDAMIVLKVRVKDIDQDVIEIRSTEESQIGDAYAQVYSYVELTVPKLVVMSNDFSISNFPNPFKGSTQFEYNLPENGTVMLRVFNMLGEQVAVPVNNQVQEAGTYSLTFDATNLVTGAYTYRFEVIGATRQFSRTGTLVITK